MNDKLNLLIVSPKHFENCPRGLRMRALTNRLNDKGVRSNIVSYCNDSVCDSISLQRSKLIDFIEYNPSKIKNIFCKLTFKLFRRLLVKVSFPDYYTIDIYKFFKSVSSEVNRNSYSHIVFVSSPFMTLLLIKLLPKKGNMKFVLDLGDPFSFNSAYNYNKYIMKLREKFEVSVMNKVDLLIVTNEKTKKAYEALNKKNRVEIIPQGSDVLKILNTNTNTNTNTNKLSLIYAGAFHKGIREPGGLYNAVMELNNGVMLDLFGPSFDVPDKAINIFDKGKVASAEIVKLYQEYDILVYVDNVSEFQTSGKIYELLGARKPILFIYTDETSPVYNYAKKFDFVFTHKNIKHDIKDGLTLLSDFDFSELNFNYDLNENSWDARADNYKNILISTIVN